MIWHKCQCMTHTRVIIIARRVISINQKLHALHCVCRIFILFSQWNSSQHSILAKCNLSIEFNLHLGGIHSNCNVQLMYLYTFRSHNDQYDNEVIYDAKFQN